MDENINLSKIKKEKIKLVVLVVSVLLLAGSLTYAFFVAGVSDPAKTDVNLGTEVSGGLVFTPGTPINLVANLTNFAEGDGSLSGETISTANLKAASSAGSATENYYIYYNVTSNNFVYTKDNTTPELLLTITDPEGNEITTLTNHPELTHKTVPEAPTNTTISGFDVTTYEGLILIDDSYAISTTDSTVGETQEWKAKLTFVNLDTVQTENEGKSFESELILRNEEADVAMYCGSISINECILNSYSLITSEPSNTSVMSVPAKGLLQHTSSLANSAQDYNFRYSGSNEVVSNNWVCFGSDEAICPEENKYRIIGIYDGSIKLIKATAIDKDRDGGLEITQNGEDTFQWDAGNSKEYATSDIKEYLNGEFYYTIPINYQAMITLTTWNVGGNDTNNETSSEFYRDNIGTPVINKTSIGKIGLMYVSDYGFAAHSQAWTTDLYGINSTGYNNQTIMDNNWLFNLETNQREWTIVPYSGNSIHAWIVSPSGHVFNSNTTNEYASRPVLYLESLVKIIDGDGSETDPFRLSM